MTFLRQIKAFRWLVYLTVLPLMVLDSVLTGARIGWDLWCAMVQQHEAGWRRKGRVMTPTEEAVAAGLRQAVDLLNKSDFTKARPLSDGGAKTIKFRRYTQSEPRGPFAATCDIQ